MNQAEAMKAAISAFKQNVPFGCVLDPKLEKPIYTLVKIDRWPYPVHYEFRTNDEALCVELHIESKDYAFLGNTFHQCANELRAIGGYTLEYHERRSGRHRKVWPSLSISLPSVTTGETAAAVMRELIHATREKVSAALGIH